MAAVVAEVVADVRHAEDLCLGSGGLKEITGAEFRVYRASIRLLKR